MRSAALSHGLSLFIYLAPFLSLAAWLSTLFEDIWKPLLIGILIAVLLGMLEYVIRVESRVGWSAAVLVFATFTFAAARRLEHQDF